MKSLAINRLIGTILFNGQSVAFNPSTMLRAFIRRLEVKRMVVIKECRSLFRSPSAEAYRPTVYSGQYSKHRLSRRVSFAHCP